MRIIILLLLMSGCASKEVLDGLCYDDDEGTYICIETPEDIRG